MKIRLFGIIFGILCIMAFEVTVYTLVTAFELCCLPLRPSFTCFPISGQVIWDAWGHGSRRKQGKNVFFCHRKFREIRTIAAKSGLWLHAVRRSELQRYIHLNLLHVFVKLVGYPQKKYQTTNSSNLQDIDAMQLWLAKKIIKTAKISPFWIAWVKYDGNISGRFLVWDTVFALAGHCRQNLVGHTSVWLSRLSFWQMMYLLKFKYI
jgi:hypothetical protein